MSLHWLELLACHYDAALADVVADVVADGVADVVVDDVADVVRTAGGGVADVIAVVEHLAD